jgi:hypothetical protein
MQSQVLGSLTNSTIGAESGDSWATVFSLQVSNGAQFDQTSSGPLSLLTQSSQINQSNYIDPGNSIKGLSPSGRNMSLFDPESAYKMMTVINYEDVLYKAQYFELSRMGARVSMMEDAGQNLGSISLSTSNNSIQLQLQRFVDEYNRWIQRFDQDIQHGGLLANTQAAHASQFELEQNFNNPFFGIESGVHGMGDLGVTIDPDTHLASLDTAQLDSMLATNKQGVVDTVQEFGANFAKSASLLNAEDNFIQKQLDNLSGAINYIDDNIDSLQAEFGTGREVKPVGQVAEALAAYNQAYGA